MPHPLGFNSGGINAFEQKKQLGIAVAESVSLPARVFLRKGTGYQRLTLTKI